jgi:hypothetical protein
MFHQHKYGKIDNGYQYCSICGKALPVGCSHEWEDKGHYSEKNTYNGNVYNVIYVLRCTKCGDMKTISISP